ncbi:MAG: STAS domain-containing protein [Deltaproteobacteria bacterium]|jgi:anti-sigma B factor antagonist|nr:STAS domain-containing protein [Deltaproteobacteria bacterium]
MDITVSQDGRFTLVALRGVLDALTAPELEEKNQQIVDNGATIVILDLSAMEFISSAGLRVFLSLAKALRKTGGEIRFAGLQEAIREVFAISGFTKMFAVFPDAATAAKD